jgi:hypothetical protein
MAYWRRPDVLRQLVIAEEDLPLNRRGGPNRRFKSANVIDLVRIKDGRGP